MLLKLLLDKSTLGDLIFMLPKPTFGATFNDKDATEDDRIDALTDDIQELYDTLGVQVVKGIENIDWKSAFNAVHDDATLFLKEAIRAEVVSTWTS